MPPRRIHFGVRLSGGRRDMKAFACVICGTESVYDGALPERYPFCSDRCKMVDLGRWFRGQYSIERDVTPEDVPPRLPNEIHREP